MYRPYLSSIPLNRNEFMRQAWIALKAALEREKTKKREAKVWVWDWKPSSSLMEGLKKAQEAVEWCRNHAEL